jgi:hypothetical protein
MTVPATRPDLSAPPIPRPRAAEPDEHETQTPWPEPWRHSRGARPRTEYWDVATASWHSSGPQAHPRPGD